MWMLAASIRTTSKKLINSEVSFCPGENLKALRSFKRSTFTAFVLRYDRTSREMPWREAARPSSVSYIADPNVRGYSCLVSEVMLQQTQVSNSDIQGERNQFSRKGCHCGGVLHEVDGQVAHCGAFGCLHSGGGARGLVRPWILLKVNSKISKIIIEQDIQEYL